MSEFSYYKEGRRFIIEGDTFAAPRGSLGKYGVGLNFDADAACWWTGKEATAQEAMQFLQKCAAEKEKRVRENATFVKLSEKTWGLRVPYEVEPGQEVEVHKSNGTCVRKLVDSIVRSEDGIHYCSVRKVKRTTVKQKPRNRYGDGRCSECGTKLETWHDGFGAGLCHDCI